MQKPHKVTMNQVSKYRWQLLSPTGAIMLDDLLMASSYKAEEWVKSYISSFPCWSYVIVSKKG